MTPQQAAAWMFEQVTKSGELYQQDAADHLIGFGNKEVAYYDDNGSSCVGKKALAEFKKISPDIVWSRRGKYWRRREADDEPGRSQD